MKGIIIILIISTIILSGCSNDSLGDYSNSKCIEPSNPYNDGGGHDAGFNWAEEKAVSSCGGNSDSFIEGCEEYLSQQRTHNNCINN